MWCGEGDYFPQSNSLVRVCLRLPGWAVLVCLPPLCLPEPVSVWSHGLFVLITQRNKDRAETKEGFNTITIPSQENKLTSIRGSVFLLLHVSGVAEPLFSCRGETGLRLFRDGSNLAEHDLILYVRVIKGKKGYKHITLTFCLHKQKKPYSSVISQCLLASGGNSDSSQQTQVDEVKRNVEMFNTSDDVWWWRQEGK